MQVPGSSGDLPNDRRHVVKLTATWPATPRLTLGTYTTWESGTPLNQFKAAPFGRLAFAVPRGTAGRLPSLWDLNLRLTYTVPGAPSGLNAVLDIMHALSPRKVVYQQQQLYLDGGATRLNPAYGLPLTFQAPMQVRLGFVLGLGAEAGAP
jgi:hypothetical protein